MTKRHKGFSLGDLIEAPFDVIDKGFEALDDGLEVFDAKLDDLLRDNDVTLDESMKKLDRKMKNLDKRLGKVKKKSYAHSFKFKLNGAMILVRYNSPDDIQIRTSGDLDESVMEEIRRRIREDGGVPTSKQTRVRPWLPDYIHNRQERRPLFWTRNWRGGPKAPLEFTPDSLVTVSIGGLFGRKYTVEIDDTTVYMVKLEELMEKYWARRDLEVLIGDWTEDEKAIMRQVLDLLRKSHIAEAHHEEISTLISL